MCRSDLCFEDRHKGCLIEIQISFRYASQLSPCCSVTTTSSSPSPSSSSSCYNWLRRPWSRWQCNNCSRFSNIQDNIESWMPFRKSWNNKADWTLREWITGWRCTPYKCWSRSSCKSREIFRDQDYFFEYSLPSIIIHFDIASIQQC